MDVRELSVGNYVMNQDGTLKNVPIGEPVKLTLDHFNEFLEFYVPIPITEEWLINFGFELIETIPDEWEELILNKYKLGDFTIEFFRNKCWYPSLRRDKIDKTITYVHRLQNLYFELTDKELTLK
jgi:hypothetical protein